ncbi:MAG: SDR family oxidoreductase, partial [Bacteroidota bacterium]
MSKNDIQTISIVGAGWLGLPLGVQLVKEGYVVKGSTTRVERLVDLEKSGLQSYHLKVTDKVQYLGGNPQDFFNCDLLVVNIPPRRRQENIEEVYPIQIRTILEAAAAPVSYLIFVGSSSVYGNQNTEVTETSVLKPETASARALVEAEKMVQQSTIPATILRMGGLAGANRKLGRFLAGKKDLKNAEAPVNLVHLDDCIAVIKAVIEQGKWEEIYNVSTDKHPTRRKLYTQQAEQLGLEAPTFLENGKVEYKLVSNEKVKRELGYQFLWPAHPSSIKPQRLRDCSGF